MATQSTSDLLTSICFFSEKDKWNLNKPAGLKKQQQPKLNLMKFVTKSSIFNYFLPLLAAFIIKVHTKHSYNHPCFLGT